MRSRLTFILFSMIATTLMGIFVTGALSAGMVGAKPILIAVIAGFVLALPTSWLVARQITRVTAG